MAKAFLESDFEGYIVEVSLPASFQNDISKSLADESSNIGAKLGKKNGYKKLNERDTLDILEELELDPLKPELPVLLLLDKHPNEIGEKDEVVLVKLGGLERSKDVSTVLDKICRLMKTKNFTKKLSPKQRRRKLNDSFEDIPSVGVSLVSLSIGK